MVLLYNAHNIYTVYWWMTNATVWSRHSLIRGRKQSNWTAAFRTTRIFPRHADAIILLSWRAAIVETRESWSQLEDLVSCWHTIGSCHASCWQDRCWTALGWEWGTNLWRQQVWFNRLYANWRWGTHARESFALIYWHIFYWFEGCMGDRFDHRSEKIPGTRWYQSSVRFELNEITDGEKAMAGVWVCKLGWKIFRTARSRTP